MLKDKIMLVTGASGGIGQTIIENYIPKVKNLISSSRKTLTEINNADYRNNYLHIQEDLTIEDNVIDLFHSIESKYGRLDILINTVGGSLYSHNLEDFPLDQFNKIISVNLTSAFLLTREASKLLKKNDNGGNIIHFVSSSAYKISHNKGPYGIAKSGLVQLIKYSASELAEYNIHINGISPAYVFTPRHEQDLEKKRNELGASREEVFQKKINSQLIKKPIYPKDIIPLVELLSTTHAITGQILNCTMGEVV